MNYTNQSTKWIINLYYQKGYPPSLRKQGKRLTFYWYSRKELSSLYGKLVKNRRNTKYTTTVPWPSPHTRRRPSRPSNQIWHSCWRYVLQVEIIIIIIICHCSIFVQFSCRHGVVLSSLFVRRGNLSLLGAELQMIIIITSSCLGCNFIWGLLNN